MILIVMGTRPEIIKLAPLCLELKKTGISVKICVTFQHRELAVQALSVFGLVPDFSLSVMSPGQSLVGLTSKLLIQLDEVYKQVCPKAIIVHGDTATAVCAGMAAFYKKIPVVHIEAGLRSGNIDTPFPEEANRQALRIFSKFHFAPTDKALQNLLAETVAPENAFMVGNTVVDSLKYVLEKINKSEIHISRRIEQFVQACEDGNKKFLLLTLHRREGLDGGIQQACGALKEFLNNNTDVCVFYPRHPNPATEKFAQLCGAKKMGKRFVVSDHVGYADMVYLISKAHCLVTDSGGLQEEGVSLGKPVVCVREVTERQEGIDAGLISLTGFNTEKILSVLQKICNARINVFSAFSTCNPFGDGFASGRIVRILQQRFPECF
ncbi:UDP-N-acetylglucosamine 2-epimerase (non-hydrolyzing) [Candidatus Babeliales bacterium]|nr:UDP-N-acetylglucosamine 2-epimerase (non-hydrolyzing) [Candidatus Babeliales bacterium]